MRNKSILILFLIIVILALSAGELATKKVPDSSVMPSISTHISGEVTQSTSNMLQLKTFRLSPTVNLTKVTSTIQNIDYAAPGLDWDDVYIYTVRDCASVTLACKNEALQGVFTEVGTTNLGPGELTMNKMDPGSRVMLCYSDINCQTSGFRAYSGSKPLPIFSPSQECIHEFQICSQNLLPQLKQKCPEVFDTNCDISDRICSTTGPGCSM